MPRARPMRKAEDPHPARAASVLVYNEHGQVLWGRRQRDGKWTLPGGHLEAGEDPATGAIRELLEEAGLVPERMHHFGTANTPGGIPVFMFQAEVSDQAPHARFDPDNEVSEWRWVDCLQGLPPDIASNLAHPRNVVCEHMGWTAPVAPAMMTDMAKSERVPRDVSHRIRALKLNGFGGGCHDAAHAINRHVFGGRGRIVGAANTFWLKRGRFLGHVAVEYGGKFWDADAQPKDYEDIESWGMLDPEDSDYHAPGWNDEHAEHVTRLDGHQAVAQAWSATKKG